MHTILLAVVAHSEHMGFFWAEMMDITFPLWLCMSTVFCGARMTHANSVLPLASRPRLLPEPGGGDRPARLRVDRGARVSVAGGWGAHQWLGAFVMLGTLVQPILGILAHSHYVSFGVRRSPFPLKPRAKHCIHCFFNKGSIGLPRTAQVDRSHHRVPGPAGIGKLSSDGGHALGSRGRVGIWGSYALLILASLAMLVHGSRCSGGPNDKGGTRRR